MSAPLLSQQIGLSQNLSRVRSPRKALSSTDNDARRSLSGEEVRVLVVDYARDTCRLIERWGRKRGLAVMTAEDAGQAFRLALTLTFRLILIDLNLPSLSGFDVLKGVRSILRSRLLPPMPAVCLTASETEKEKCRFAGFDAVLIKPIDESALGVLSILLPRPGNPISRSRDRTG
ncbi:MAG: response regulator [Candidatus Aminicenantes bacterium]|nr:response regulator [Candidatus Aminicenantes bacterium]